VEAGARRAQFHNLDLTFARSRPTLVTGLSTFIVI
jgi:hypothetical protein